MKLPSLAQVLRAGLQSGTIMTLADIFTQLAIQGKTIPAETEAYATAKSTMMTRTTTLPTLTSNNADHTTTYLTLEKKQKNDHQYDLARSLRWTLAGLILHGPYFFVGFSLLDQRFPAPALGRPSWKLVLKKTTVAQLTLFPPYLMLLFGFMGILEGHPDIGDKLRRRIPEAFVAGSFYWPVVNSINFAYVPASGRVPYLALCASAWNSYLSWTNQR